MAKRANTVAQAQESGNPLDGLPTVLRVQVESLGLERQLIARGDLLERATAAAIRSSDSMREAGEPIHAHEGARINLAVEVECAYRAMVRKCGASAKEAMALGTGFEDGVRNGWALCMAYLAWRQYRGVPLELPGVAGPDGFERPVQGGAA